MKLAILTVSKGALEKGLEVAQAYKAQAGVDIPVYGLQKWIMGDMAPGVRPLPTPLSTHMGDLFQDYDGLICIMATGIVVRTLAPFLGDKERDPAVVVMDEAGQFVISLLSGHLGGANKLSEDLAALLGAQAVITTASDVTKSLSVDMLAQGLGLHMTSLEEAKRVTAHVVSGLPVDILATDAVADQDLWKPPLPDHVRKVSKVADLRDDLRGLIVVQPVQEAEARALEAQVNTHVARVKDNLDQEPDVATLVTPRLVVGIGCRKDTDAGHMRASLGEALGMVGRHVKEIKRLATVDIKANEKAILQLEKDLLVPLVIVNRDQISQVQDQFSGSDFVEKTIGVRSVAEPCGYIVSGQGTCLLAKTAFDGITISIWEEV